MHVKQGQTAKIYSPKGATGTFGEVIGTGEDGKILVVRRSDFANLKLHNIDLFLDQREVRFISMEEVKYQFQKP